MFILKEYKTISFKVIDSLGIITIEREKQLNALNRQVLKDLNHLLDHIIKEGKNFSLKALAITGSGEKAFIAGADIKEMQGMKSLEAKLFSELGQTVTIQLETLSIPTIALVNGFAMGGGLEMALACDLMIASKNAIFAQPEVKLGLIPGFGGTQRLVKKIGPMKAKYYTFTGLNFTVIEAREMGLVLEIFDSKEDLLNEANRICKSIAKSSPLAINYSKELINMSLSVPIEIGLKKEAILFEKVFKSDDKQEGTMAFIEKRKPNFKGK